MSQKEKRHTIVRRIEIIGDDNKTTLKERCNKLKTFSIALDESTDATYTVQLAIFIRQFDVDFYVLEEL